MSGECGRIKQSLECHIADVETAGISAKCRQDHAAMIGSKTAAADGAAAAGNAGNRMQMAGNFERIASRKLWHRPEQEFADC